MSCASRARRERAGRSQAMRSSSTPATRPLATCWRGPQPSSISQESPTRPLALGSGLGSTAERGHDAQPAGGLPGARLRARLPVHAQSRPRPAARPVRALEAARRGDLPAPSGSGDRCSADVCLRARSGRAGGSDGRDRELSRRARSRASRSSSRATRERVRDFVYVDDLVPALEAIVVEARWNETLTLASGVATPTSPCRRARPRRGRLGLSDRNPRRSSGAG